MGENIGGICKPFSNASNTTFCNTPNQTESTLINVPYDQTFGKIITSILFGGIIVASLIGNTLVARTILQHNHMKTACNYFIMNIAFADIGVGAIAAPLRVLEIFLSWPFGDFMCRFLWPFQDVFVCVSVLTHTIISLERYRAIVKPFKAKISLRRSKIVIVAIWLGCYCASGIPQSLLLQVIDDRGWKLCAIRWPSLIFRLCYIFYLVIVFIIVPLVMQTWCYVRIVRVLNQKAEFGLSTRIVSRKTNDERKGRQKRNKRMVFMLITSLLVFQVCYIPRGILMLMVEFQPLEITESRTFSLVDLIFLVLYYCKHIVNPVILFAMSSDFRKALTASLSCSTRTEQLETLLNQGQVMIQESPQETQEATV